MKKIKDIVIEELKKELEEKDTEIQNIITSQIFTIKQIRELATSNNYNDKKAINGKINELADIQMDLLIKNYFRKD